MPCGRLMRLLFSGDVSLASAVIKRLAQWRGLRKHQRASDSPKARRARHVPSKSAFLSKIALPCVTLSAFASQNACEPLGTLSFKRVQSRDSRVRLFWVRSASSERRALPANIALAPIYFAGGSRRTHFACLASLCHTESRRAAPTLLPFRLLRVCEPFLVASESNERRPPLVKQSKREL